MQTAVMPLALELELPWSIDSRQEERFRNILLWLLIPLLAFLIIVPWMPVFELSYESIESDEVVTTVLLKPLEEVPQPEPEEKKVVSKSVPVAAAEKPEEPRPSPKMAQAKEQKIKPKQDGLENTQGLNELSSQLTALRGSLNLAKLQTRNVTNSTHGQAKRAEREFLGRDGAVRRSDGIEVDEKLVVSSGSGLAEYTSTTVDGLGLGDAPVSTLASHTSYKKGQRDMESIRRTLERTKSSVHSLYQQALMDNPSLAGKFTFKLVIQPDGSVSNLSLLASELGLSDLERSILDRIRAVNFGAREVSPTVVEYKFVFLPS